MKRIYITALFCFFTLFVSAQSIEKDTLKKSGTTSLTTGDIQKLLPQITPKSPNVSAMERFGDYPVSMYSGLASIEIPLYEIKVGNIIVPIKLVYHPSGIKVNDNASWVGMGWSITGDYTINRNVRSISDESDYANGNSLLQNNLPVLPQFFSCLTPQLKIDLNLYSNSQKDIERDIFTYNTPFKSNSFVVLPNQTGVIWQEPDRSIFSYTGALQSLKLTDERGIEYVYQTPEVTSNTSSGIGVVSAWHLNCIQGVKATDQVKFTYQATSNISFTGETTDTEVYHTDIAGGSANTIPGGFQGLFNTPDSQGVSPQLPKEIIFPMGKVVFVLSNTNRLDNLGKSLDFIEVYGYNVSTNQYTLLKKYAFIYVYKQRINTYAGNVALFLDQVNLVSTDNLVLGSYRFDYNAQDLPATNSKAKDFWGYYNGQTQNSTLIPPLTYTGNVYSNIPTQQTFQIGGANRDVNDNLAKAWILEKITYPTGGFSTFDYESNRYQSSTGQRLAGGLRIAQIISNDGGSSTKTKTYKYGMGESGNGTLRSLAHVSYSTNQRIKRARFTAGDPDYFYNVRTFSSAMTRAIGSNEGSPVTYPVVTEYEDNGTGANGKTIYTFKDDVNDDLIVLLSSGKSTQRNRFWNRGQLLNKVTYGFDGKKKYEQTNTYTNLETGSSSTLGYLIGKSEINLNELPPNSSGCLVNDDFFDIIPTNWNYGLVKLTNSFEKYYDNQDDTKFTLKRTDTYHSATHYQPTEIRESVSNGIVLGKLFWYAQDFATIPSTTAVTGEVFALKRMQQRNMLNMPIEEIDYRRDLLAIPPANYPNASNLTITGGKFSTFAVILGGNSGLVETAIVPKTISLTECIWNTFLNADNSINFTAAVDLFNPIIHNSIIPRNINHKPRLYFDQYDTSGNLEIVRPSDGPATRYVYNNDNNDGIPFVYPFSETQQYIDPNPNNLKSLTTFFGFEVPLLGMSFLKEPSNLKTYFEYDNFGRLLQMKDHNLKIIKKYQYKY